MVETAAPRVTLRNYFSHPYDSAIAAARTCYSPTIVSPEEVTDKQRLTIGAATFEGGHHTVYQHAHFEFGLENVSRQFVWSFLHSHPFYNSEQQSQRYVRLDRAAAYVPPLEGEARAVFEEQIERAWSHYRALGELLMSNTQALLADIWHLSEMSHERRRKKVARQAEKKAIEIAPLRFARGRLHQYGAHAERDRAAPAVADAARGRHPDRSLASCRRDGRAGEGS